MVAPFRRMERTGSPIVVARARRSADLLRKEIRSFEQTLRDLHVKGGGQVVEITLRVIAISDEPIATWSDSLLVPQGTIGEIAVAVPNTWRNWRARPASSR